MKTKKQIFQIYEVKYQKRTIERPDITIHVHMSKYSYFERFEIIFQ